MPTVFWDARQLLDCYPLVGKFKCTGTTAKGARCGQTFIDRKSESDQILSMLSSKNIVVHGLDDGMKAQLRNLAELTLCPRWHRTRQVDAVYLKWSRIINEFIAEERARVDIQIQQIPRPLPGPQPARVAAAVPDRPQGPLVQPPLARVMRPVQFENGRRRPQARDPEGLPDPLARRIEDVDEIQHRIEELHLQISLRDAARERLNELDRQLDQEQADIERDLRILRPLRGRPQQIPPLPQPPVVVENNAPNLRARPLRLERIAGRVINAQAAQAPRPAPPTPQPAVQQAPARVPPHVHRGAEVAVVRKPLDGECYVCYEPFDGPENAVWCRGGCGQNMHKECFAEWSRTQRMWNVRCGYCRARWI